MAERDQQDDPAVWESIDAFRRAGTAASNGVRTLYEVARTWLERQHSLVRAVVALSVWFAGNWTYNRLAPTIIGILKASRRRVSFEIAVVPAFETLQDGYYWHLYRFW